MRLVIVGPGALGCVFAAALANGGHDVALLGRPSPHLRALREHGLILTQRSGKIERVVLNATDDPAIVTGADTLIVLVKTVDTIAAMTAIAPFVAGEQLILTLQNGLGNAERIRAILGENRRILPGTTAQAATRPLPGRVVHAGDGPTWIGFSDEADADTARTLARVFTSVELPATATPDIERHFWRKAAINAAINGLTALGGFRNGAILDDLDLLNSAEILAEEAANVARAKGIELGGMRPAIVETAAATADNRSSMLQDLDAGRPTEVTAIHGAILAAGEEAGVDAPAIRVVASLIGAKERMMAEAARRDE